METREQIRSVQEAVQRSKGAYRNLSVSRLVEEAIRRRESRLTDQGAICSATGQYTGRSPKDKFFVDEPSVHEAIDWGSVNQPLSPQSFARLYQDVLDYVQSKNWFVFDGFAGADKEYRLPIQVVNEYAWHNLFAHQLFIRPAEEELAEHRPAFTILSAPGFFADPGRHGTRSETFIVISFEHRVVLIGGTEYAGEIKKSVFTLMNYLLPQQGVLPMHCSANVGQEGDVALFFGLSGTGKTTLSTDPLRRLIGDDEHAWSKNGVFNIEGGCYAKCIHLSQEKEPQIFNAIRYGAVLENVVLDEESRVPRYDDDSLTENTRAAYPLEFIPGAVMPSIGGHPQVILFLTADAYGVLPPISRLSKEQAMYHFLSGYTSKLAGTERGVTTPEATFSTCFGAPFFPLRPDIYAEMLGRLMEEHGVQAYLVNTGWHKGPYGVGERMNLRFTRAMVTAAVSGALRDVETVRDEVFGLSIPTSCPGVPEDLLLPRSTWPDPEAYDVQARALAARFAENFQRFPSASDAIRLAGPQVKSAGI